MWPTFELGELCEINVGRTPARNDPSFWGHGAPWLSIADMNQGKVICQTKERITPAGTKAGHLVQEGTVLMSFKLSIGKVAVAGIPLYTNEAIAALPVRDVGRLEPRYLLRALEASDFSAGANRAAMGATLNKAKLQELQIPLPPLDEQRRIAAILDQAEALRAKRRRVAARLDILSQSIFLQMFGEHAGRFLAVQDLAAAEKGSIRTGPFGSQLLHSEFVDDGIAVLGLDNVVGNEFTWGERRYITPEKYSVLRRYTVHPGDVLVSIMGTCGRCVVVPSDVGTAINTKHICAITINQQLALPEFVRAAFLWHPRAHGYLKQRTKGSIMDGLNMGIVKEMPLPVPGLPLQREFVARSAAVATLLQSSRRSSIETDALFASLQSRAFRGELQ